MLFIDPLLRCKNCLSSLKYDKRGNSTEAWEVYEYKLLNRTKNQLATKRCEEEYEDNLQEVESKRREGENFHIIRSRFPNKPSRVVSW